MGNLAIPPIAFTAGETVEWRRYISEYLPQEGWNLSYSFRNFAGGFDVAAIPEDDHYLVLISADKTASYESGNYWWQATITKDVQWHVIGEGSIEIKPNLAFLEKYDGRSHVKKVLEALEAMILGKASRDQLSYSISGRSLSRLSPAELLKWRDVYKAEYARELQEERLKQGLGSSRLIKVRFSGQ